MNFADLDALYVAIGEHHVSGRSVAQRVGRGSSRATKEEQLPRVDPAVRAAPADEQGTGVHVEGLDDVMVRLSRCCTPVPVTRSSASSPADAGSASTGPTAPTRSRWRRTRRRG